MQQLLTAIPDVEVLLALEPEELAAKIVFLLRSESGTAMFNLTTRWLPARHTAIRLTI